MPQGIKILIAEDNENNKLLLRDLLNVNGYETTEVGNGIECLKMARELMPDLILMDIQMPGMDGVTAAKLLKKDELTSELKIIALTSFAMHGDAERFLAKGFDGYLAKPINTRELPGLVKKWLGEGE